MANITATYHHKNLKISPRKLRLAVETIKKLHPAEALLRLKFTNTNSSRLLVRAVKNAIANATNKSIDLKTLKFDTIRVDEGQKIKRMDKSHGSRFARGIIQRRHSRLEIILSGSATEPKVAKPADKKAKK